MIAIGVLVAWLAIGAAVGLIEARRGHWHKGWVVSAVYGPLAIPLAREARQRESFVAPVTVERGQQREGLAVLVGIDGSEASKTVAATVVDVLADRLGRLTLAAVLDFDTADSRPGGTGGDEDWPERAQARATLQALADELSPRLGLHPETVLLAGDPPTALQSHAADNAYDVLVAGTRGRGLTKLVFGSCAAKLGHDPDGVAVLLVPTPPEGAQPAAEGDTASGGG